MRKRTLPESAQLLLDERNCTLVCFIFDSCSTGALTDNELFDICVSMAYELNPFGHLQIAARIIVDRTCCVGTAGTSESRTNYDYKVS